MSYAKLREQALAHRSAIVEIETVCSREWICPDRSIISVRIDPSWEDPAYGVSLTYERWVAEAGSTRILRNGIRLEGGYTDYVHDAARYMTAQQLEWMAKARRIFEKYVAGEISELPPSGYEIIV